MVSPRENAERARRRSAEVGKRLEQIRHRRLELSEPPAPPPDPAPAQEVRRAAQLAEQAKRRAAAAYGSSIKAHLFAAQMHEAAADVHEALARTGSDPDRHMARAEYHRASAAHERTEARRAIGERVRLGLPGGGPDEFAQFSEQIGQGEPPEPDPEGHRPQPE